MPSYCWNTFTLVVIISSKQISSSICNLIDDVIYGQPPIVADTLQPYFPSIVENVTVSYGRKAVLKCEVDNLRNYKVE